MLLARRQPAKRAGNFHSRQGQRLLHRHSFQHFRQRRATRQRWRAAIRQKPRRFDPAVANPQTQTQTIAAYRVRFLGNCVGVGEFPSIARVGNMIGENIRVSQKFNSFLIPTRFYRFLIFNTSLDN